MGRILSMAGLALATTVLLSAPVAAQGGAAGQGVRGAGMMAGGNPASAILEHRAELELTDDQVRQLESIRARLEEVRSSRRAAGQEIRDLLTADQQAALRPLMRSDRARAARGQGRAHRPSRGQGMGQGMAGRPMVGGPGAMVRNPAATVLEHRDELELTDVQVRELEAIRSRVEEQNSPRLERLRDAREDAGERMGDLRPLMGEVRATNRAAGEEIHQLLTDEQETRLRALMHADRPRR